VLTSISLTSKPGSPKIAMLTEPRERTLTRFARFFGLMSMSAV